jgi:hypothetical protein
MTRLLIAAALLAFAASEAMAGYAPLKYSRSRDEIAAACGALGAEGQGFGLDETTGGYGCTNTENGNAVICEEDGRCTDYSGDPRRKRIEELLGGRALRPA